VRHDVDSSGVATSRHTDYDGVVSQPLSFFVYGPLLSGEPDHHKLEGCELVGAAKTVPGYRLVELGPLAALIREGEEQVTGEVYRVAFSHITRLDAEHPALYQIVPVALEGMEPAMSFVVDVVMARGRRRIHGGDWRARFAPKGEPKPVGALVSWARARHTRGS
jgi:gamma-glutamylaminecyclotransferase